MPLWDKQSSLTADRLWRSWFTLSTARCTGDCQDCADTTPRSLHKYLAKNVSCNLGCISPYQTIWNICQINHRLLQTELCERNIQSSKWFLKCCRTFWAEVRIVHTKKYNMLHLKKKSFQKTYMCVYIYISTVLMVFNKDVRNYQR